MTEMNWMSSAEGSSLAQQIFEQIEQELGAGMVPQIFKLLESQPVLLAHLWGQFRAIILKGKLPRVLKELLGLVVATATNCDYVRVIHFYSLTLQGVDKKALEAVTQGDYAVEGISTATRNALRFATLATATRAAYEQGKWQDLRQQTIEALEAVNIEGEEKFELVATIALFEQICSIANLLALDPARP